MNGLCEGYSILLRRSGWTRELRIPLGWLRLHEREMRLNPNCRLTMWSRETDQSNKIFLENKACVTAKSNIVLSRHHEPLFRPFDDWQSALIA